MPDEPTFFYYAGPQKVKLELVEDTVAVAFDEPIPERRVAELRAGEGPADVLGRSPALLSRNVLVHRTGPSARGPARVRAFAERLSRGPSVRFVNNVFRNPDTGLLLVPTDEIIVRFRPDVTEAQVNAVVAQHGIEIVEQKSYAPNQYVMRVPSPSPQQVLDVANALHESELVQWAEPNWVMEKRLSFQAHQWALKNTGQAIAGAAAGVVGEDVKAYNAWQITKGSGNVVIAIFDEGVETNHPGLQVNIAEGGRNFEDPNDPNNPNPDGNRAHGTACAGVAAGVGHNSGQAGRIDGVAPMCKILPIKMLLADNNATSDAIHYAAHRAQILSNSWEGGGPTAVVTQAFEDVIAQGREGKGTVVVFAAGNSNQRIGASEFSRTAGIVVVGASTNVASRAGYSNFGDAQNNPPGQKRLSVVACSAGVDSLGLQNYNVSGDADGSTENIYTTDMQAFPGYNPPKSAADPTVVDPNINDPADDFDYSGLFSGTSAACPLVAGICGLMLSVNADLTRAQVKYIVEATAAKIGNGDRVLSGQEAHYEAATGYDVDRTTGLSGYGYGRIDAEQAVKAARGDAILQLVRDASGTESRADTIPVVLHRQNGTNHFVSESVIELIDARCGLKAPDEPDKIFVRGGPGGFLRATYQPSGGGPAMTDEVTIQGEPT